MISLHNETLPVLPLSSQDETHVLFPSSTYQMVTHVSCVRVRALTHAFAFHSIITICLSALFGQSPAVSMSVCTAILLSRHGKFTSEELLILLLTSRFRVLAVLFYYLCLMSLVPLRMCLSLPVTHCAWTSRATQTFGLPLCSTPPSADDHWHTCAEHTHRESW